MPGQFGPAAVAGPAVRLQAGEEDGAFGVEFKEA
jgi:hypothetical protein